MSSSATTSTSVSDIEKAINTANSLSASAGTTGTSSSNGPNTHETKFSNVSLFGANSNLSIPPILTATDPTTFNTWKGKFKNYCMMNGIDKIVFEPATTSVKAAANYLNSYGANSKLIQIKFRELHSRSFGALAIAIEPSTGQTLVNEIEAAQDQLQNSFINQNANELWTRLIDKYEKKSAFATLSIFKQLIGLSYQRDESPTMFRQRLDTLLLQLNRTVDTVNAGEKLSEGIKAAIVLNALPNAYNTTIQTLLAQPIAPTIDSIFTSLQRLYDTNEGRNKSSSSSSSGDMANTLNNDNNNKRNDKKNRYNKKKSHQNNYSSNNNPNNNPNTSSGKEFMSLFFDKCEKPLTDEGLYGINSDDNNSELESDTTDSEDSNDNSDIVYAATADGNYENNRVEFILDTGASKHMVYDRSLVKEMKNVEPTFMKCALNKRVEVKQLGRVRVNRQVVLNNVACIPQAGVNLVSVTQIWDAGATVSF